MRLRLSGGVLAMLAFLLRPALWPPLGSNRAMPKQAPALWRAPGVSTRMCVEGGYLRVPRVLVVAAFPGDDGEDIRCTRVGKSESWLAEAVTGKHVSTRSLNRTSVFDTMRQKASQKPASVSTRGSGGDLMSELVYEDAAMVACHTPVRKKRRVNPRDPAGEDVSSSPQKKGMTPIRIRMKETASSAEETVDVSVVLRKKELLLDVAALPWLLGYLQREMEDGPVIAEDDDDEKKPRGECIYWDFHNSSWVARATTPDGESRMRRAPITARMREVADALHGLSRAEAKQAAYEELREWVTSMDSAVAVSTAPADAVAT